MSRWFRFYDDAINDPKILKLSDKLHRVWVGVLCVASKNDGTLPSIEDMALMIRMKPEKLREAISDLTAAGLIDDKDAILAPHNWAGRQFKSDVSTERVKRFRNGERNVSETPPDTEQNRTEKIGASAPPPPDPKAELFRRGREILGGKSGGIIAKLLKSCGNEDDPKAIAKARARVEDASTKTAPAEWLGRVLSPQNKGGSLFTEAGEAWPEGQC